MRLACFHRDRLGLIRDDRIIDVTAALDRLPPLRWPLPPGDPLYRHLEELRPAIEGVAQEAPSLPLAEVALDSPVRSPSKVIAAPVNYKKHLDESRADVEINRGAPVRAIDELGVFLKSSTSVIGPSEPVRLTRLDRRIDHELELAVIIGKEGKGIARESALDHVAGYCIGLDMSVRGTEDRSFRKSFDSFTVLGPAFVSRDEIADVANLDFRLSVNGEVRQQSNTALMIWDVARLIDYASSAYTLYPGDVILSGTPEGVAPVRPGDLMECWFEGLGSMSIEVA